MAGVFLASTSGVLSGVLCVGHGNPAYLMAAPMLTPGWGPGLDLTGDPGSPSCRHNVALPGLGALPVS